MAMGAMKKSLALFSGRAAEATANYIRFRHTRTYIIERSAKVQGLAADRHLMAICSYRRIEKFRRRRPDWDALSRPLPLTYLSGIGVALDSLMVAAEADMSEFIEALSLPAAIEWAVVRWMPAIYGSLRLPRLLPEADAVSFVLDYARTNQRRCCIRVGALKSIFIEPTGETATILYPPSLAIKAGFLVTGSDGSAVGTCRIGR